MADWDLKSIGEGRAIELAELFALALRRGDLVELSGDLGAGKSTFARALIRAMLDDRDAEVPSPTFSLVQSYETARFEIAHLDLYRLRDPAELGELGLEEALMRGAALVEWPERAEGLLPEAAVHIDFAEAADGTTRDIAISTAPAAAPRLARALMIDDFLTRSLGDRRGDVRFLQGDASARGYARLRSGDTTCLLMDAPRQPDGPAIRDGKPYSRIAHLAEDVRPFVAISGALRAIGLNAPRILAQDLEAGLLLIEDFGDGVFGRAMASGVSQRELWCAATDVLLALHRTQPPARMPLEDGSAWSLPALDHSVLDVETELVLDWYWPSIYGTEAPAEVRQAYAAAWADVFSRVLSMPSGWMLRDYHSPNLIWRPGQSGMARVGVIDFQDALCGPPAYDLVSLLQDARQDVEADLDRELFEYYVERARHEQPGFCPDQFRYAYVALGAQRNSKILGIFARLARRDGKTAYLAHIPRIWRYLERDLADPHLAGVRRWYDHHLPAAVRTRRPMH